LRYGGLRGFSSVANSNIIAADEWNRDAGICHQDVPARPGLTGPDYRTLFGEYLRRGRQGDDRGVVRSIANRLTRGLARCFGATVLAVITAAAHAQIADVQVSSYTWNPDPIVNGSPSTFTVVVGNNGPSEAPSTEVRIYVPSRVTVTTPPAGCTLSNPPHLPAVAAPYDALVKMTCQLGTLAVNETRSVVFSGNGNAPGDAATRAEVSANEIDSNAANDFLNKLVTVIAGADLAMGAKTPSSTSLPAGSTLTYTLAASNAGPDATSAVRITDNLPPLADLDTVTASGGPNWTCTINTGNPAAPTAVCTYTGPAVAAGGAFPPITIQGRIVKAIAGTITNSAFIASTNPNIADTNATNDTNLNPANGLRQPVTVSVLPGTDLAASKQLRVGGVPATQVLSGGAAVFRIGVTNNGPQQATGV
jgi:uncharacterized repeat protein (TIGR01451 family)